jgi:hypothetical protein
MVRKGLGIAAFVLSIVLAVAGIFRDRDDETRVFRHKTRPVTVDSIDAPTDDRYNLKLHDATPELMWLTGHSAITVDSNGTPESRGLVSHNTLSLPRSEKGRNAFGPLQSAQQQLFTLSGSQDSVRFPSGFGIPVSGIENLVLETRVHNLREERIGKTIKQKIETLYVFDRETTQPMKALMPVSGGIALDIRDPDAGTRESSLGRFIPIDTTAHYISVHMHDYAKSLELHDATTGETVFKAMCKPTDDGRGLAETTFYSSETGLKVYKDHEYRVISESDNTSTKDQAATAFIVVYLHNPDFVKPTYDDLCRLDEFCTLEEPK